MNSQHKNGGNDMDLNEDLDRFGQRYGQLQQDEPPELLDLAILNSAHRAVDKEVYLTKFGWLHGLTTAAVFVLAFSLILKQTESPSVFEDGSAINEPVSLEREVVAKKQSLEDRSDDRLSGIKNEARQEIQQSMPSAAVAESPAAESVPGDKTGEAKAVMQRAGYVNDSLPAARKRSDKDTVTSGLNAEDIAVDEEDLMADTPLTGVMDELELSGQLPEPAKSEALERAKKDPDAERRLAEIISLKQSGDETWKTALQSFRESYPDYPLPDELVQ
jgi:hypothetical protein